MASRCGASLISWLRDGWAKRRQDAPLVSFLCQASFTHYDGSRDLIRRQRPTIWQQFLCSQFPQNRLAALEVIERLFEPLLNAAHLGVAVEIVLRLELVCIRQ